MNWPSTAVARVTINWSEISGGDGRTFVGLAGIDHWLRAKLDQAALKSEGAYGDRGCDRPSGYLKTEIEVVWCDGERFTFRVDLNYGVTCRADALGSDIVTAELVQRAAYSREKADTFGVYSPELCAFVESRLGTIARELAA